MFITLHNVTKSFGGTTVLNGIDFELAKGEFAVILGTSGAGKSTLLRCMNGLALPSSGSILIDGIPVKRQNLRQIRRKVGFIFQNYNVVGNLSVMQNVLIGTLGRKAPWNVWFTAEEKKLAEEAIEMVGLSGKRHARADQLSGGQKQRVGIARVLAQKPEVLLADEPVSSLDPVISREIMDILQEINHVHGTLVVCNLHQLDYATAYGRRIIGIRSGKVQYDGVAGGLNESEIIRIYGQPSDKPVHDTHRAAVQFQPAFSK